MYASFDPLHYFLVNTRIATEMQAAQGLRLSKQGCKILDSGPDQSTLLQVQVDQEYVILDKVFEACDYFLIETGQFDLCLTIYDLLRCQGTGLLFEEDIIGE